MYPGSPIDSSAIRPGRGWYAVAAVTAVLGIGLGAALLVWGIATGTGSRERTFSSGSAVTVRLKPTAAIYVPQGAYSEPQCAVTSPSGGNVRISSPGYSFTTSGNGRSWELSRLVHVPAPGDYRVTCTGTGPYAVGQAPKMTRFVVGIVSFVALGGIAFLTAVTIVIVTAVRRSSSRNRLRAQAAGIPPMR